MVKNVVGKTENAGYHHFLLYQQYFQNIFLVRVVNTSVLFVKGFNKSQILDSSKRKEFEDYSFKFDENGRKFFERTENTVG